MTLGSFLLGLVYYAAALLCLAAFKAKKKSPDARPGARAYLDAIRSSLHALMKRRTELPELARAAAPWFFLALFISLLGLVRQLNLQALITEHMHTRAVVEGWYWQRSAPQLRFIAIVATVSTVVVIALLFLLRKRWADIGMAALSAALLWTLLGVRAVSHHGVDEILMTPIAGGVRPAYLIEALGLALIALNALVSIRRRRAAPASPRGPIVARIDRIDPP